MSKLAKSPERFSFQKEGYINRCEESGKEPNPAYLEMFENLKQQKSEMETDTNWQQNNLEYDLRSNKWICDKAKASDSYAQNLYAAMCNMQFVKNDVWPLLKDQRWSCSWRSSGGIVADMREQGDYMDWYCSGMGGVATYNIQEGEEYMAQKQYVPEGTVTEEIAQDLKQLGWIPVEYEND